ncbi:unnamed protein product [Mytilus edulis]|uniref:B box-type domain-containing protein n=1 Tax=Mytilus edulis TaxID=6550 RepID=A0A8S3VKR9_MYTED|nr:unnamed protein product [Mytilus edulis]
MNVCGVCEYRNINKPSVVWCSECDEGLCRECKEHHQASKGTRNHSIVQVSEYQELPSGIFEITQTCPKHSEKYQIFCNKLDSQDCRRCVTETHNDCKEIDRWNINLAELSGNLQRIRKDRQENIKSLMENRVKIEKEVRQTRSLINNHLDILQESLIKETESTKTNNIISSIQENERQISESQTTLDKIKQHASDLQTFLALKHIQRDVTNNEQFLESLIKGEKIKHVSMSWKTKIALENSLTRINMGTIILDTRPGDVILTNRKNKQAQIMLPTTPVPTIDNIKLTLKQTVKTKGSDVSDCCLLPDGEMIFSCFDSGKVTVIKTDGTLDVILQPEHFISHICFFKESPKLVVTIGHFNQCIRIIDMKTRKIEKSISVGSQIYGVAHKEGKLYYSGYNRGLCVVSLDDDSITQLVNVTLSVYSSIAIWSDNLYFINMDNSLSCCDLQGGVKWKLELKAFLKEPRGITVDNYGRVYVSGYGSNNVVVISPDGNKHRLLLSEKDGLKKPQSLCFDRKNNKLLVANQQNDAFLYDVSK